MTNIQPDGYLALPHTGNGNPVLVLHAWWGLNKTIKAYCNRLADSGFVAFAPDLYHGQLAATIPEAESLSAALDDHFLQAKEEVIHAASFLADRSSHPERGLAVIGFSLGAYYALDLSVADPGHVSVVVVYYGTGIEDFDGSQADYLGHFAENDPYEPESNVAYLEKSIQKAGRSVTLYSYPATGHWFAEPDRAQAYNQTAAELAWDRTLAFLTQSFIIMNPSV